LWKANRALSDADLHMTALALELCCIMMADQNCHPNVGAVVCDSFLPQALVLVRSSLLQGQALQALQIFFCIFGAVSKDEQNRGELLQYVAQIKEV